MNKRGQAALEYLMTYGWALIVIAIVVGVLVFIVSSPAGNIVCNSNDPAKIMVKASQVTSPASGADIGTIKIINLTGGNITSLTCRGTNGFGAGIGLSTADCPTSLTSGAELDLLPDANVAGTHSSSTIVLAYTDYASLSRTATITCSGPLTTS